VTNFAGNLPWSGDQLVWGASDWAWPAVIIAAVLSLLVIDSYRRRGGPTWVRFTAATLKIIAIGLVALCLVEPMARGTRPRPRANVLPILMDTSQSMMVGSQDGSISRLNSFVAAVDDQTPWMTRLGQSFDLRRYRFDDRIENVNTFQEMTAGGNVSSMSAALQSLAQRFDGRPVAGVLLMTDGNATDVMGNAPGAYRDLGFPVYPIVAGNDADFTDLRIETVGVRQTDFESAPTTVTVTVDSTGMDGETVTVRLQPLAQTGDGETNMPSKTSPAIETQTITLKDSPQQVKFRFRPGASGVQFYVASVFTDADRNAIDDPSTTTSRFGEATLINNRRIVTIDRDAGPYRVLYVAGRPNWEFKFLRRALSSDAEIQLVGLVRIADKEPKFSFRDRGVSDTNPLFAGLGKDEEEIASQYDEPVILRFGVKESEELSDGFPESDEELFAYHAVILDDIETDFFSQDQLLRLRRFVSARGGGLLMLGGTESFAGKRFGDSPLGELSPVYPSRRLVAETPARSAAGKISLTREGLLQTWTRLRENETAEQTRLAEMPSFLTVNPVGDVKPGASELAVIENADGEMATALATQRFGKGRTAAIPVGDLWRWSMRQTPNKPNPADRDNGGDDPARAWRQTMRWLVGEVPRRVQMRIESAVDPTQPTAIVVEVRDDAYLPLDNATVDVTVVSTDGKPVSMAAEPGTSAAGTYMAKFWARDPGGYKATATVTAADGSDVGSDQTGWTSQTDASEMANLKINRELLGQIASQTGGEVIELDDLASFADDLPNRKVPVTETWVYPLWHRGWVMMVALGCLCGEWGLRRWKGLP
jgi:uncharacterized membrane protein